MNKKDKLDEISLNFRKKLYEASDENVIKEEYSDQELRKISGMLEPLEKNISSLLKDKTISKDPQLKKLLKQMYFGDWSKVLDYYTRTYQ